MSVNKVRHWDLMMPKGADCASLLHREVLVANPAYLFNVMLVLLQFERHAVQETYGETTGSS